MKAVLLKLLREEEKYEQALERVRKEQEIQLRKARAYAQKKAREIITQAQKKAREIITQEEKKALKQKESMIREARIKADSILMDDKAVELRASNMQKQIDKLLR